MSDASALAFEAARALLARPDPVAAVKPLEDAAAGGPAQVAALRALVRLRTGLGQDALAAAHGRALLALRPGDGQARFLLGRSLRLLGWNDLALRQFRLLPQPLPAWWLAMASDAARELSAARAEARPALRAWRRGRRDAAKLAALLIRAGRPRAAAGALATRPVEEQGDWAEALLRLRLAEGDPGQPLGPMLPDPGGLYWRDALAAAKVLLQLGETGAAGRALAAVPDSRLGAEGALLRGRMLLLSGDLARLRALAVAGFAAKPHRTDPARLAVTALVLYRAIPVLQGPGQASGAPPVVPLVQYWNTPDPPADVRAVMESWVRHNPALPLARFHAASARDFLAGIGAEAVAAFDACHHPAMQADLLRMVFLARHGGVWADVDERCTRPVDDWLALLPRFGLLAPYSDELPYYVHSYVMAAPAGSAVMERLVARMLPPLLAAARRRQQPRIWEATGPGLVTRAVAAEPDPGAVALLAPEYFRGFVEAVEDLAYRRTAAGNWRLA